MAKKNACLKLIKQAFVKVVKLHSYITRLSGGGGEKKKELCCVFQNSWCKYLTI
jgi:hypothetical protein